ncbi:MAG: hypothetical protein LUG44_03675 [Clostridiales bacterium]|nr:hypothetical protein [Clostridiales bacterium]
MIDMDITWKEISAELAEEIAGEFAVSKSLAKKLLLNALTYNVVTAEIKSQIEYMLEGDNE